MKWCSLKTLLYVGMMGLFLPCAWCIDSIVTAKFQEANELYRNEQFSEAADVYSELMKSAPTAEIYFNAGNAYYRAGQLGKSILNYERALRLSPRNRDIRFNLQFVRSLLEYRIEDNRNWYVRAVQKGLGWVSSREIILCVLFLYLFFLLSFMPGWFKRKELAWGVSQKILGALLILGLLFAGAKYLEVKTFQGAIVTEKEAEVRYGPSSTDQIAFRIGEGLKVYVMSERENWSRVVLVNGESGWIRNSHIAFIDLKGRQL